MPEIRVMYDSKIIKPSVLKFLFSELLTSVAHAFSCGVENVSINFSQFGKLDYHRDCQLDIVIEAIDNPSRHDIVEEINKYVFDAIKAVLVRRTVNPESITISIWTRLSTGAFKEGKII